MNESPACPSLAGVRVACFYPWVPFESSGAWTRFACLWRFLLGAGAEVSLAFIDCGHDARLNGLTVRFSGDKNVISNIGVYARKLVAGQASSELRHYSQVELNFLLMYEKGLYLSRPKTGLWLDEIMSTHDVVTCDYPMYAPLLSEYCRKWHRPLVVTSLDLLFELHATHPGAKERLRQKEVDALRLADALVFCNDDERKVFEKDGLQGATVLNTGDVLNVTPGDEDACRSAVREMLKIRSAHYCLFVGSIHKPNVEAANEVRTLAKKMPELSFVVAGSCLTKEADGNFVALGPVSDQFLETLYRGALAVIVPLLHGTGMSVKVFQAFTYGKAVVTTAVGARGYAVTDCEQVLLAPSAEFPAAIRRLASDSELRQRLAANARAYALQLDFRTHFRPYAEIITRLTGRNAGAAAPGAPAALVLVDNNLNDRIGHHFNYALSIKEQCAAAGVPFRALIKQTAVDDVLAALGGARAFTQGIHEPSSGNPYPAEWPELHLMYDLLLSNDLFAQELEKGLAECAKPGDQVFLPNATPRQILGLALLLKRSPAYRMLRFVLMLRYTAVLPVGLIGNRKGVLNKESAQQHAMALERLVSADPEHRVRFVTDSRELAQEYAAYTKRPFEVLPIPHTTEPAAGAWPADIPPKAPQTIRVVFMGDAREEKGFELLPAVVRACNASPAGRGVEFVFQAYISSHYHRPMAAVIDELGRMKQPNLHLIGCSLSTESYQTLLHSADLVLIPYDAVTYRARTSGPFVEAICANKPVVVPRDSWMSAQLGPSGAGVTFASGSGPDLVRAVLAALTNLPHHATAAAELGRNFRDYHNPQTFLRQLMPAGVERVV